MRKLAFIKVPFFINDAEKVYKIVMYSDEQGTYVFIYTSPDAVMCSYDNWYPDERSAIEEWQPHIDLNGWQDIGDPMPDQQHDALLPLRVRGRNAGKPQWGCFEIFEGGGWKEYKDKKV